MFAPSNLVSVNSKTSNEFLKLAQNPGGGSGGTCFGDSGGPDLLGATSTVLGVNSYVTNVNCSGVGYSQRIDIPDNPQLDRRLPLEPARSSTGADRRSPLPRA